MRSYEERAKDFIAQIFPYIERSDYDCEAMETLVDEFNKTYSRKVILKHGIARIALITSDYVVKYTYDAYEAEEAGDGENEIKLYAEAERDGFAYLFAKVTRYEYNNYVFYIMPRIHGIDPYSCIHADEHMTDEENDWCDKHHLTDLHCNNYGFRKGHVCIVDYAYIQDYGQDDTEDEEEAVSAN